MTDIPIATPMLIPSKRPISNPRSELLSEIINSSLFEINKVELLDLEMISEDSEPIRVVDFILELYS